MRQEHRGRISAIFLLVLLTAYMFSVMCFTHIHLVDGAYIVHSHPFSKEMPHDHSKSENVFFYTLTHYLVLPLTPNPDFKYLNISCVILETPDKGTHLHGEPIIHHFLRAPPSVSI